MRSSNVLGLKSPQTAVKRANALLRVFRWHLKETGWHWPWSPDSLAQYSKALEVTGSAASATQGLFEALRFGYHVMGIPFESNLMYDRRLQGRAKRFIAHSAQIKQAEPLSVELVARLENLVASGTLGIVDRYLLCNLFKI